MWKPETEEEIVQAIDAGTLRESGTFDAKQALPTAGRNKDLARDICAMTPDGGVLLYGVGGDDPTRPDQLMPLALAGAAERVDQVAQTAIAEPPVIEITDIPASGAEGTGYLVVTVPPSPRAQHMVTLDGDNRYYGRGATGNRILTESDVARLYERRERWKVDRDAWLADVVQRVPFRFEDAIQQLGPIVVVARPVAPSAGVIERAAGEEGIETCLRRSLPQHARTNDPYPGQGTSGLGDVYAYSREGADKWIVASDRDATSPYQARLELRSDGQLTYWHSPTLNSRARHGGQEFLLMEQSVTRAVHQLVTVANWFYERGHFAGAVDMGLGLLGIEQARAASLASGFEPGPTYGAPAYLRHDRVTAGELADTEGLTRRLLDPLYDVISVREYDPYAARGER